MMREDNLLAIRQKAFRRLKESGAKVVFPNLLFHVEAKHPNEVWVSDITYIRLRKEPRRGNLWVGQLG